MLNINFVPDDYIQNNESRRANFMYLILFAMVMAGLAGAFGTIKVRQHAIATKQKLLNERMVKAKDSIKQFEELQEKRKEMMKTALTTANLFEPVHRSVILASITNNLPSGTSLLKLEVKQEKPKNRPSRGRSTRFQQASNGNINSGEISPEKILETKISMEGMAPSDLQVAAFIENLGSSALFENVALVESMEEKNKDESKFRKFKLTAMLKREVNLTTDDIEYIRERCQKSTHKL